MGRPLEIQSVTRILHDILILSTLREGPKHGYQIALEIEERSGEYFAFKHGTLYPILHHLEKEGYIDGEWGSGRAPRRRKEYLLTGAGEKYLRERQRQWNELSGHLSDIVGAGGTVQRRTSSG